MDKLRQNLHKLASCTAGVAMIEFAIAIPTITFVLLSGLELTNLVVTHMRINQIAITVADNAGRVRTGIDEQNIYEVFAGAELIGRPFNFPANGRVILSSLQPNEQTGSNNGQMINWQRCFGSLPGGSAYGVEGTGRTNSSLSSGMGRPGNRITAAPGTAVMFVEVNYRYRPIIFPDFSPRITNLRYEAAFNVRERTNQNITNTQNLPRRLC